MTQGNLVEHYRLVKTVKMMMIVKNMIDEEEEYVMQSISGHFQVHQRFGLARPVGNSAHDAGRPATCLDITSGTCVMTCRVESAPMKYSNEW